MSLENVVALARNEAGIAAAVGILKQRFGERAQTGQAIREQHGHTTTYVPTQAPDIVVFAENTQDVQDVVRICAEHRVPVVAFGAGSSLEGQVNAPAGGVSLDMTHMNRVIAVHAEDLDCVVEPGVTRRALNEYLRDTGLFFPIDPGANATLGGMASTRASGTNAVRYGTMRENVLALKAVMPDGRLIETSKRVKKTAAGYDLTRLLIGAEGTLGIITELTLKLQGIPQAISGGICPFPDVDSACRTVIETIQMGIPVARIELVNTLQMQALIMHSKLPYEAQPYLFVDSTARKAVLVSRRNCSARLPPVMAAVHSNGRMMPKNATGCGGRGTRHILPRSSFVRAARAFPPMSAFRSRALPTVSARRKRTLPKPVLSRRL